MVPPPPGWDTTTGPRYQTLGWDRSGSSSYSYAWLPLQWLEYTEGHERWWDAIWQAAAEQGLDEITMTPEHGPPNYQVTKRSRSRSRSSI